jgi:unsaturated rhamnogalacturonyl hydrolase
MGWYVMAIVDTLDLLPASSIHCETLVKILNRLAAALLRFQDPDSGLWYQVVDLADRAGNYRESSASAMLAYLAPEFGSAAQRAYRGLLENMIRMDADGSLTLDGTCSVAGLGGSPYRDGSFEYYVNEPIAVNDFKGVGPFILAALEMDKVLEKN